MDRSNDQTIKRSNDQTINQTHHHILILNNKPNVEDEIRSLLILLDERPYVFYNNHNRNQRYWDYKIDGTNQFCLDFVPKDGLPLDLQRENPNKFCPDFFLL